MQEKHDLVHISMYTCSYYFFRSIHYKMIYSQKLGKKEEKKNWWIEMTSDSASLGSSPSRSRCSPLSPSSPRAWRTTSSPRTRTSSRRSSRYLSVGQSWQHLQFLQIWDFIKVRTPSNDPTRVPQQVILSRVGPQDRLLRGKAFECASIIFITMDDAVRRFERDG